MEALPAIPFPRSDSSLRPGVIVILLPPAPSLLICGPEGLPNSLCNMQMRTCGPPAWEVPVTPTPHKMKPKPWSLAGRILHTLTLTCCSSWISRHPPPRTPQVIPDWLCTVTSQVLLTAPHACHTTPPISSTLAQGNVTDPGGLAQRSPPLGSLLYSLRQNPSLTHEFS